MKTPKEYAIELVEKYDETLTYLESKNKAKQCALIAVDEIIEEAKLWAGDPEYIFWETKRFDYLREVKQEIEKL